MKSYTPLIIAFLLGAFAVSAGWGGAIYAGVILIGLVVIVVVGVVIMNYMDQRKINEGDRPKDTSNEKDVG